MKPLDSACRPSSRPKRWSLCSLSDTRGLVLNVSCIGFGKVACSLVLSSSGQRIGEYTQPLQIPGPFWDIRWIGRKCKPFYACPCPCPPPRPTPSAPFHRRQSRRDPGHATADISLPNHDFEGRAPPPPILPWLYYPRPSVGFCAPGM